MSIEFLTRNQIHRFRAIGNYIKSLDGVIAYWDMQETSGTNATAYPDSNMDGTHSNVTVGVAGSTLVGNMARYISVSNSYTGIYSAALNSAFAPNSSFSINIVWRWSATGVGASDGGLIRLDVDGDNLVQLDVSGTNSRARGLFAAGGTGTKTINHTITPDQNIHMSTLVVDRDTDTMEFFVDAVSAGTLGTLGTWAGNLREEGCTVGALNTVPNFVLDGDNAHVAVLNRAKSLAEIKRTARLMGVL